MAIVAIIGRPNVGKSTLFNRITRSRKAIVDDIPGVTRDRIYAYTEWRNKRFLLVDTAGIASGSSDSSHKTIESEIQEQVKFAIDEASAVIFLTDVKTGISPQDKEILNNLRRLNKPFFLAVNKVDSAKQEIMLSEFYELGVEEIYPISAIHGRGVNNLLDNIVEMLPARINDGTETDEIKIAVVGRPNVGKSTLINRFVGSSRVIVSEIPGTTRDSVDVELSTGGKKYILVDTAGIRRKGRVREKLEKISVIKALESIERSDLAILLIDATEGPADQDLHIGGYIQKRHRACIIAVNKWDLVQKDKSYTRFLMDDVKRRFQFLSFAPIIRISATTGKNVNKILPIADDIFSQYTTRISTGVLNRTFQKIITRHHPPQRGGRELKFYYITQPAIKPPTFVIFCNRPDDIHFSYERYLTNQIRKSFNLDRAPIRLIFRGRTNEEIEG